MKTYDETAESVIERRNEYRKKAKRRNTIIASVLAVCIAAGAGTGFYLTRGSAPADLSLNGGKNNTADTAGATGDMADTGSVNSDWAKDLGEIVNQRASFNDMAYCLLRYNGQDYRLWDRTEEKFAGDYIGHTCHGYGDKNGYSDINGGYLHPEELSCDVGGEIYKVKNFGEDVMVCIKSDVNGKYYSFWNTDREIKTGADLIGEKAYNLKGNLESLQYQSHSDWDIGVMIYRPLADIEKADFDKLIDCICAAPVLDLKENYPEVIPHDETQRHIILAMNEDSALSSMTVRLYKGGYVWFETLCNPGVFFKIDDPVFDKIYNAAKDIKASVEELKEHNIDPNSITE